MPELIPLGAVHLRYPRSSTVIDLVPEYRGQQHGGAHAWRVPLSTLQAEDLIDGLASLVVDGLPEQHSISVEVVGRG